jgi:hypothetical protein
MLRHSMLFALLLAGCGGGSTSSDVHSCDLRQGSSKLPECVEFENVPAADVDGVGQSCEQVSGGRWLNGACDHTGAVGGCRIPPDNDVPVVRIQWWWPGAAGGLVIDAATAQSACSTIAGAVFVNP